ncbi:MAG: hypothetical protein J1E16_04235 [Muribaculaceae bacterium]|nr:hypothetical protein [Muribaculaceae bacterium]
MQKDIIFSGFSTVPSDHEVPDGALAASVNLINEDGALHPVLPPSVVLTLPSSDFSVIFIHKTAAFTHYLIGNRVEPGLWWIDSHNTHFSAPSESDLAKIPGFDQFPSQIQAIGNTLIVKTDSGMNYFLWKGNDYKYLGNHLPECRLQFGLKGALFISDKFELDLGENINLNNLTNPDYKFSDEVVNNATETILGKVNRFIAENATQKGLFIFPFFVRWAYRLYDGSLTMHSAPVLMATSSFTTPRCNITDFDSSVRKLNLRINALCHKLLYNIQDYTEYRDELNKWSDIISSIDIFVSAPLYSYDQNGKIYPHITTISSDSNLTAQYSICSLASSPAFVSTSNPKKINYQEDVYEHTKTFADAVGYYADLKNDNRTDIVIKIPQRSNKDDIEANANFFFIHSLPINSLYNGVKDIDIPEDYLQSLTSRELMTDDYQSHDIMSPKVICTYNNRLHIADFYKTPFLGFEPYTVFPLSNTYPLKRVDFFIYLRSQDYEEVILHHDIVSFNHNIINESTPIIWLFYPDANAFKAVIAISDYDTSTNNNVLGQNPVFYEVPLAPHPTLNGAYWFGWDGVAVTSNKISGEVTASPLNDIAIHLSNKLYTSEVNNPFFFPLNNIVSVGTGEILAIASAAKPLSTGQFGQFPLYAFTSEGVWALEISSTGTYSARQPITRDVCLSPDGICSLDSSVIFTSQRGLMLLQGSTAKPISDTVFSNFAFDVISLPKLPQCIWDNIPDALKNILSSRQYPFPIPLNHETLSRLRIIYDYSNQRLIVFEPHNKSFHPQFPALIFSLKSNLWGMANFNIADPLNSYPEALAMSPEGQLLDFSNPPSVIPENSPQSQQLLVSRPMALDSPNDFKTVRSFITRGYFRKGKVKSILYASRDLFTWHVVKSSDSNFIQGFSGSPYKYFRIALLCTLQPDESINSASVLFFPRLTNKPR